MGDYNTLSKLINVSHTEPEIYTNKKGLIRVEEYIDTIRGGKQLLTTGINYNDGYVENMAISAINSSQTTERILTGEIYGFYMAPISFSEYKNSTHPELSLFGDFLPYTYDLIDFINGYTSETCGSDIELEYTENILIDIPFVQKAITTRNLPEYMYIGDRFFWGNGITPVEWEMCMCNIMIFVHEVLLLLQAQEFVIVGETNKGINILKYISRLPENMNVDVRPKLEKILELFKSILRPQRLLGNRKIHLKLTITPFYTAVNIGSVDNGYQTLKYVPTFDNVYTHIIYLSEPPQNPNLYNDYILY